MAVNVISLSGGKDSTALALLAIERNEENIRFVFCNTGNEANETLEYISYLDEILHSKCGKKIEVIEANFKEKLQIKATKLNDARRTPALKFASSCDSPFLQLAALKGRFPSTMARFCTEELKVKPIKVLISRILATGEDVENWSGVRAEESPKRATLPEREFFFSNEQTGAEAWHYRPILKWSAKDCFEIMKRHGVKPNPLYKMGFARVGCFPCINCRKAELRLIAEQFPEYIRRIKAWESIVSDASKRGESTFFTIENDRDGIFDWVEWAKTDRGGKQFMLDLEETTTCKSVYGLCE